MENHRQHTGGTTLLTGSDTMMTTPCLSPAMATAHPTVSPSTEHHAHTKPSQEGLFSTADGKLRGEAGAVGRRRWTLTEKEWSYRPTPLQPTQSRAVFCPDSMTCRAPALSLPGWLMFMTTHAGTLQDTGTRRHMPLLPPGRPQPAPAGTHLHWQPCRSLGAGAAGLLGGDTR